ncbi:hypothetical protein KIMH_08690 [Bombiscardovia apis]|uniref:Methionine aminopeptidase n=1 Tax=Bombiscardovia apis TaxID=2932182 RepID=A0ABM8BCW2_9BIFI|nr:hypothetical protein [Bombiscardovia apis]BDR54758.1 hypothetical protein KIMH_08690 [Bombiscardovia apis]
MDQVNEWYFNTSSGQAEQGKLSPLEQRMGPYPSKEAAEQAWKIAQQRNKKWEEDNKKWKQSWDGTANQSEDSEQDDTLL